MPRLLSNLIDDILSELPPGERRSLAEAVLRRVIPLLGRLVQTATADELKQSLTAATDVGTLSRLLAEVGARAEITTLNRLVEASAATGQVDQGTVRW